MNSDPINSDVNLSYCIIPVITYQDAGDTHQTTSPIRFLIVSLNLEETHGVFKGGFTIMGGLGLMVLAHIWFF